MIFSSVTLISPLGVSEALYPLLSNKTFIIIIVIKTLVLVEMENV